MGIRFTCPNGHKLHVKAFLAGKRGVCPKCGVKVQIPIVPDSAESEQLPASESPQAPSREIGSLGSVGTSTPATSQSIIIAVSDSPEMSTASNSQIPAADLPPLEILPDEPVAPPANRILDEITTSPADRYVVLRERNRRKQMNTAILLLVSVIVLACVLILVLKFNAGPNPATTTIRSEHSIQIALSEVLNQPRS
jgi:hypothetical protein